MRNSSAYLKANLQKSDREISITPVADASSEDQKKQYNANIREQLSLDILELMAIVHRIKQLELECKNPRANFEKISKSTEMISVVNEKIHRFQIGDLILTENHNDNTLKITGDKQSITNLHHLISKREIKPSIVLQTYQNRKLENPLEKVGLKAGILSTRPYNYDWQNQIIYVNQKNDLRKSINIEKTYDDNRRSKNRPYEVIKSIFENRKKILSDRLDYLKNRSSYFLSQQQKFKKISPKFNLSLAFVAWRYRSIQKEMELINSKLKGMSILENALIENQYDYNRAMLKVSNEINLKDFYRHRNSFIPKLFRSQTQTEKACKKINAFSKQIRTQGQFTLFSPNIEKQANKPHIFPKCSIT